MGIRMKSILLVGCIFLQYLNGLAQTTPSLSVTSSSMCVSWNSSGTATVAVANVPANAATASWSATGGGAWITNGSLNGATVNINNINSYISITVGVSFYDKNGNNLYPGPSPITVNADYYPNLYSKVTATQIYQNTANPVDLTTFFNTPGDVTSFSASPNMNGLISGNNFNPGAVTSPPQTITVTCQNSWNRSGCAAPPATVTIKVVDGNASLPVFLRPLDPLPICQNATSFNFAILSSCSQGVSYSIGTNSGILNGSLLNPAMDAFTGLYLYQFAIDPSTVPTTTYSFPFSVTDQCQFLAVNGYIPVTPNINPNIFGLNPSGGVLPTNNSTVNICPASLNAVNMEGFPSGGSIQILMGNPLNGYTTDVTSNALFVTPTGKDASFKNFIPSDIFNDPSLANKNLNTGFQIVYTYPGTKIGTCQQTFTAYLQFLTPDTTSYQINNTLPYCWGDSVQLQVIKYNPARKGDTYKWSFSDGYTVSTTSHRLSHLFADGPGVKTIRLQTQLSTVPTGACNNDVLKQIAVGARPQASFDVRKNFAGDTASLSSNAAIPVPNVDPSTTTKPDTIYQWFWSWDNTTNNSFVMAHKKDTVHSYASPRTSTYQVVHVVKAGWGCTDTIVRQIPIFPVENPTTANSVLFDFNTTTNALGWYQSGQYLFAADSLSSWVRVVPDASIIKGQDSSWITSGVRLVTGKDTTGYYNNEHSWVESPCYNLQNLALPMLNVDTWVQADNLFDGVQIQYALCNQPFGKENWVTIGSPNTGQNWYTSNSIISAPGGVPAISQNLYGWTGTNNTSGWLSSAYNLDNIKALTNPSAVDGSQYVRFRIIFGSNADNTPNKIFDGFAFDNFFIGQRNRNVLVEEFCDYQHFETGFTMPGFKNNPQLIRIQYHTRYMTLEDQINNQNIGETGARDLLYGVSTLPRAAVDGYYSDDTQNPFFGNVGEQKYNRRLLQVSPFSITIHTPTVSGNALDFSVNMTRNTTVGNPGPFVMQVAVLEDSVNGNGVAFSNVFRKYLPYASGQPVAWNNWPVGPGGTKTLNRTFTPFVPITPRAKDTDTSLILVAFVQDENTSEVYQSQAYYVPYSVAKNLASVPLQNKKIGNLGTGISVFPNPAQHELNVSFDQGFAVADFSYQIVDAYGHVLLSGTIAKNTVIASIPNIQTLIAGLYQFQLSGNGSSETRTFTIVR
jgi:hypothetical protein